MPNGYDKNWIRLCAAIDGFRARHGRWPTRVRAFPMSLGDFQLLFTPEDLAKITSKLALVPDEVPMVAEDDSGAQYNYGQEGFPDRLPDVRAADWLDVSPHHTHSTPAVDEDPKTLRLIEGVFKGWDERGCGFIVPDDGSAEVPVHEAVVYDPTDFEPGQRVALEVEMNPTTREPMAVRGYKVPPSRSGH